MHFALGIGPNAVRYGEMIACNEQRLAFSGSGWVCEYVYSVPDLWVGGGWVEGGGEMMPLCVMFLSFSLSPSPSTWAV